MNYLFNTQPRFGASKQLRLAESDRVNHYSMLYFEMAPSRLSTFSELFPFILRGRKRQSRCSYLPDLYHG